MGSVFSLSSLHISMKITFLGGGNMARALIGGLRNQGASAAAIQVIEPQAEQRERLSASFGVRCIEHVDTAALDCAVLLLAVKPQQMQAALKPLAGRLQNQLVVSIAAGLQLADIAHWLGNYRRLVRVMPNMPALIGAGISGLFADASVSHEERQLAEKILAAVGQALWVEVEEELDAVTAISGSGPAYVFYFIEALQQAGRELGLSPATARQLALATFTGAAQLAAQSTEDVGTLREQVTSKGGTTAAALTVLGEHDVAASLGLAARAAARRSAELALELGRKETTC